MPGIEIPKEKWSGQVREVTFGATADDGGTRSRTVTVGGETSLPFLQFEGEFPHAPALAIEILDQVPADWPQVLLNAWNGATGDVADWAKAAGEAGADVVALTFTNHENLTADYARETLRKVLEATGLPVFVFGPGQAELDNEILVPVAEEGKGERLLLGVCEEKNYRTIVAAALANDHLVSARTAMDVNLAKQLNILINDMGLPLERVMMDPTCGALGYGMEYGYSVMERLRLAALQGDSMTQMPMIVNVGEEAWRAKEARASDGVPESWGDWTERALNWEAMTAGILVESGADVVAVRHPESLKRVRATIDALLS